MRFVHLADVHLGAVPDRGMPWSIKREQELWDTFRRVITYVGDSGVDFLLITGDLFHRQPLIRECQEVNYLFTTIPKTKILMIAGNHDYLSQDSPAYNFNWNDNVYLFKTREVSSVRYKNIVFYGHSYFRNQIEEDILKGVYPLKEEGLHILLAHGGDNEHIPFDPKKLWSRGFDYVALGHIHKPAIIQKDGAAYCGALEPIDKNDLGVHGFIEGYLVDGRLKIEFKKFAKREYRQIIVKVDTKTTQGSLEDYVKNEIYQQGGLNIYKVILKGERNPHTIFLGERFKSFGNIVQVIDDTHPAYDLDELKKLYKNTLVGNYIEYFTSQEMTPTMEKALYYGLNALLETRK